MGSIQLSYTRLRPHGGTRTRDPKSDNLECRRHSPGVWWFKEKGSTTCGTNARGCQLSYPPMVPATREAKQVLYR